MQGNNKPEPRHQSDKVGHTWKEKRMEYFSIFFSTFGFMAKKCCFIVPLVIYPFDVMVSLGQTDAELTKDLKKVGAEWVEGMKCVGQGKFFMDAQNRSLIRLWNYPETCSDYGSLQHEIFHAVTFILDRIGMKLRLLHSDEAYAYLVGYLTEKIYEQI